MEEKQQTWKPLTDKERVELYYGRKVPERSAEEVERQKRFWAEYLRKEQEKQEGETH